MVDKSKAMWDYLQQCPGIRGYLLFNSITEKTPSVGLISVTNEADIERYVDGSAKRAYTFAIAQTGEYDPGTSDTNLDNMQKLQEVMDWIEAQEDAGNYPDFGPDCIMESIELLQNMPTMADTSPAMIAKYIIQCRVTYYERRAANA